MLAQPFAALVNNAGFGPSSTIEFHDLDNAKSIYETNVFGVLYVNPRHRCPHPWLWNLSLVSPPTSAVFSDPGLRLMSVVSRSATTQKFLPLLRQYHGRVIMVSSLLGKMAIPGMGVYSSSKFALEGTHIVTNNHAS